MISGRILFFILPALAVFGIVPSLAAEDAAPSSATTTHSDVYPQVSCTTTNPAICADVLQMASDTRDQLVPKLKLGKKWRFPVHIRVVTPDDPLAAKIDPEAVTVLAQNGTLTLDAVVPSTDSEAHVFVQRQLVTALLWEKFFASDKSFDTHTRLDVVPLWLVEGLSEWLDDDPDHNRESIVKRAAAARHAPTLDDITDWHILSDDPLVELWQRAFCYYLVASLIENDEQLARFQEWLATVAGPNPAPASQVFPTEAGWEHDLLESSNRSRDIVYSWDETVAELSAAEAIAIPSAQSADTRICTIDTVTTFPRDPKLLAAVQQKVLDLTSLELRAHSSWHPILDLYRTGLNSLVGGKDLERAQKTIAEAQRERAAEMDNHQKLLDYINWFEVTKDYAANASRFRSYFSTAKKMEQIEADPDHPNPIRADLLHVESQL